MKRYQVTVMIDELTEKGEPAYSKGANMCLTFDPAELNTVTCDFAANDLHVAIITQRLQQSTKECADILIESLIADVLK